MGWKANKYEDWLAFYMRRKSGNTWKRVTRLLRVRLKGKESGTLEFMRRDWIAVTKTDGTRQWLERWIPLATLGQDNLLHLHGSFDTIWVRRLVDRIVGNSYSYSAAGALRRRTCTTRIRFNEGWTDKLTGVSVSSTEHGVPLTDALVLDLAKQQVVDSTQDFVLSPNRRKSRHIYKYVDKVMALYPTMVRMEVLPGFEERHRLSWDFLNEWREKITAWAELPEPTELTDENLAYMVELGYMQARIRGYSPVLQTWNITTNNAEAVPVHETTKRFVAQTMPYVRRFLIAKLQHQHGCVDHIPTNP